MNDQQENQYRKIGSDTRDHLAMHQGKARKKTMPMLCLGARVMDPALSWAPAQIFLAATLRGAERHQRRPAKTRAVETSR